MGRIKSTMVKKAARQLIDKDLPFSDSFENNKKILGSSSMPSKPIRNKIAGYMGRMTKMRKVIKDAKDLKDAKALLAKSAQSNQSNQPTQSEQME